MNNYKLWDTRKNEMVADYELANSYISLEGNPSVIQAYDCRDCGNPLSEKGMRHCVILRHVMTINSGGDVYEGDIISIDSKLYKIIWSVTMGVSAKPLLPKSFADHLDYDELSSTGVVVVGNIYENPELLEVDK
ncbi:hypothetical protein KAU11_08275 [Candidatus Babeliales bacterium]|nr:hypothetical protein [Candidatus Babeliales bacterium]